MKRLFILITLFSCQSSENGTTERLTEAITEYANSNQNITQLEISDVTYSMVGQNTVDSIRMTMINLRANELFDSLEYNKQQGELHAIMSNKKQSIEYLQKGLLYSDSVSQCTAMNKEIRKQIAERSNDSLNFYKVKYFVKATIAGTNIMDTAVLILDKDYRVIDTRSPI